MVDLGNQSTQINELCRKNIELFNAKAVGTYNNHCAVNSSGFCSFLCTYIFILTELFNPF